ncbi:hypothetical protein [Prochlorococcus marinus]|nr:hypothetical protein [Prochlorococcus marinus]
MSRLQARVCLKTDAACPVALERGGMIGLKAWPESGADLQNNRL